MSSKTTAIDQADVDAVLALEPRLRELVEEIGATIPPAERLAQAGYAGADRVLDAIAGHEFGVPVEGDPQQILVTLEAFRVAAGDLAAHDYHRLVTRRGLSLREAADEVFEADGSPERVERFRRYAAERAR